MTTESEVLAAARKLAAAQSALAAADTRHAAAHDELKRAAESQANANAALAQAQREFNALISGGIAAPADGAPKPAAEPAKVVAPAAPPAPKKK